MERHRRQKNGREVVREEGEEEEKYLRKQVWPCAKIT
jgi:hypothetical protein